MTLSQWVLIATVSILLTLVIINKLRLDIAALLIAVILGVFQYSGLDMLGEANAGQEALLSLSGFSQPVVITLIALFVLTRGLEKSGLMRWVAHRLIKIGGSNERTLIFLLALTSAVFSLFINNVAAGMLVLPSAIEVSRRTDIRLSKLLIPVSYGSLLGGMTTYFTTANIVMSDLLKLSNPPQPPLDMLDFVPTGGLIAITVLIFLTLFGPRFLPSRQPSAEQTLQNLTGSELESMYNINERLWEIQIQPNSPIIGKDVEEVGFGQNWGATIIAIQRKQADYIQACADRKFQKNDVLLVTGRTENIERLKSLNLIPNSATQNGFLSPHGIFFAEVILTPHSNAQGRDLRAIDFRQRYGLTVVAIKHEDEIHRTNVGEKKLSLGDSMLVVGTFQQFSQLKKSPDFIIFEPDLGDQPVNLRMAILSSTLMISAILVSLAGVPIYLSIFAAAIISMLIRVVEPDEAYRAVEWQTIFVIAGMYVVSLAMVNTGLAELIGNKITALALPLGLIGIAAGAYLLSALLTQLMGGQVTAMVTGPIMLSASLLMNVDPHAVAVATAIGCSASFLTPIAHPVNIMMVAPANYRFSDFFKAGWIPFILSFLALMAGIYLFWS